MDKQAETARHMSQSQGHISSGHPQTQAQAQTQTQTQRPRQAKENSKGSAEEESGGVAKLKHCAGSLRPHTLLASGRMHE